MPQRGSGAPLGAASSGGAAAAASDPTAPAGGAEGAPRATTSAEAAAPGQAVADSPLPDALPEAPPDEGALPQTDAAPTATPALEARARLLTAAIARDEPALALPFFFPKAAYEQVKDVSRPAVDWKVRLLAAYNRDVRDANRKLGRRAAEARFVALEIPAGRARWVAPGEEANKIGYHRVFGSRLVLDVGGRRRTLEIKSLISWRGEWFVVHFAGMK